MLIVGGSDATGETNMNDRIHDLLKKLEWSDRRQGPGTSMRANDGYFYAACPVCRQLKEVNLDFRQEAVGHKPDCELKIVLEELDAG